jgi:hypothetical protein
MLGTIHSNPSYELGEIDNNRNDSNPKNYNWEPTYPDYTKNYLYSWKSEYSDKAKYNNNNSLYSLIKNKIKTGYHKIEDILEKDKLRYERKKEEMANEFEDYYYKNYGLKGIRHNLTSRNLQYLLAKQRQSRHKRRHRR